jgi:hypothetical protein
MIFFKQTLYIITLLALLLPGAWADLPAANPEVPDKETTAKALAVAILQKPEVANATHTPRIQTFTAGPQAERGQYPFELQLRAGLPEGAGAALTYTPLSLISTAVGIGTTGATWAVSAEANVIVMPKSPVSFLLTAKFSHIRFTQKSEQMIRDAVRDDEIEVQMVGRNFDTVSVLGGLDFLLPDGFGRLAGLKLYLRGGRLWQIGAMSGGDDQKTKLQLTGLKGVAGDAGVTVLWF